MSSQAFNEKFPAEESQNYVQPPGGEVQTPIGGYDERKEQPQPGYTPQPTYNQSISAGVDESFDNNTPQPFSTGICDCWGNCSLCMCAWCCSPCLFGRSQAVMNREPNSMPNEEYFNGSCLGYYCLAFCTGFGHLIWQAVRRTEIRRKYNLEGSKIKDWGISCCCSPCGLAQEDVEICKMEEQRLLAFQNGQQRLANQNL